MCLVEPDPSQPASVATEVAVRPATSSDMPSIRALIAAYPDELLQADLPRIPSFFVAESGGEIVGCCALQIYSKRLAEVRSLAVRPDWRGRGIAGRLVDACRTRGRERRVRQLFAVTSEPRFFESRGFTVHRGWKTAVFDDLEPGNG